MSKKKILLKLTGELFVDPKSQQLTRIFADQLIQQIKDLQKTHYFAIVIGGGSFFRGERNNCIGLRANTAHSIGMIATTMTGLMFYDLCYQHDLSTLSMCGFDCPMIGAPIAPQTIDQACQNNRIIIFSGGTGNPFVSTDTNAVIRAQQVGADEMWKASKVDGAYNADPHVTPSAQRYEKISIQEALDKKLNFMDHTALIMAQKAALSIRLFNAFDTDALIQAAHNKKYGTMIIPER